MTNKTPIFLKEVKSYSGIGSRLTPQNKIELIKRIATYLAQKGLVLRSGGAPGADEAFEKGCDIGRGAKEIFLPWGGFNKNNSSLTKPLPEAFEMAKLLHPQWSKCSPAAKKLHARNVHQVLGPDLKSPVNFVVYWAEEKNNIVQGGTATAVNLATSLNIPTYNLLNKTVSKNWENCIAQSCLYAEYPEIEP